MTSLARAAAGAAFLGMVLVGGAAPATAQDVLLEKSTNGQDADSPPGPILVAGDPVTWTYEVSSPSGRDLVNVVVTDDQGVTVTCPSTTVAAGASMTCTANGIAVQGQYANLGTVDAELTNGTPVSDSDPSHYLGVAADAVTIEKSTEGFDADTPTGPSLAVGDMVDWTYEVTNTGAEALMGVTVTDDQGVTVVCPQDTLAPDESMTCTASGVVQPGQYANLGTVMADTASEEPVADSDPSHYFGQTLLLEKRTEGVDADVPPGPTLPLGSTVEWTYEVTNPGPATVTKLSVTDDQGVVVTCPQTTLTAGESVVCTGSGTVVAGQYSNVGTASAELPLGGIVSGSDQSHYVSSPLAIEKSTNGQDADLPPGPVLAVGDPVTWSYEVTNAGSETLTDVTVTDDQGVTVTCPQTSLDPGELMICTANGSAVAGQYTNVGTAEATDPTLGAVSASDPSHYLGQDQDLDFGDLADPPYPTLLASNGPRHLLGGGVYLGACVDAELDGQPSAAATGDDAGAGVSTVGTCATAGDDEDGVALPAALVSGSTVGVDVTASAPCTLSAFADFTADGDFQDAGEILFPGGAALAAGVNGLSIDVPAGAVAGSTAFRFRCTTDGEVPPAGEASDGEVEDYLVVVVAPAVEVSASKEAALTGDLSGDGQAGPGDTLTYTVTVTNTGTVDATGVVFTDTPDSATALVVGSVTTTQGTVVLGNTAGDASVEVDLGTLAAAGGTATVTYQVTVDAPLPAGTTEVVNQGVVSGDGFADVPTDDPAEPGTADPTVVAVVGPVQPIPGLGAWGLLALLTVLASLGVMRLGGR